MGKGTLAPGRKEDDETELKSFVVIFLSSLQALVHHPKEQGTNENSLIGCLTDRLFLVVPAPCRWCPGKSEGKGKPTVGLSVPTVVFFLPRDSLAHVGYGRSIARYRQHEGERNTGH